MFAALHVVDDSGVSALVDIARDFTPRFEICDRDIVVLDLTGLTRLFGHPRAIGEELHRTAAARGVHVRVAIAATWTTARVLAGARKEDDLIVIEPGSEAAAVGPLPLSVLADMASPKLAENDQQRAKAGNLVETFHRWGLHTLGDLTALPADAVATRLGLDGVRWHRLSTGSDLRPLDPAPSEERFEQALDLEWPIEGLEPLSFVLGRLLEPLAAHLERRGRGAAVLRLRLHLVTRDVHERSLELPAPMRDARTFRTLLLLDLESHPPSAAIDRVVVAVDPTPARVLQFSLLTRPLPSPEQLSTLLARLTALMGEGRCGSPVPIDSWQPGACGMKAFNPEGNPKAQSPNPKFQSPKPEARSPKPTVALRRFRVPIPVRIDVEHGRPVRMGSGRRGLRAGLVDMCAGPWRTSGAWWTDGNQLPTPKAQSPRPLEVGNCSVWDRDEWDVMLGDGATYRIFHDRTTKGWFVEGVYD